MNTADDAARTLAPVLGMARAGSGSAARSWGTLVAWRVRFWLLALVIVLGAANSHVDTPQEQAGRVAANQAWCSGAVGTAARKFASVTPHAWRHHEMGAEWHCDPGV